MAKNIEPMLKLISGYLKLEKCSYFVIPEYQRSYSWNITQCDKLWQDIESFIESGASDPYFFGTIILDCSVADQYHIIDGQQRTTTFFIILKALLIQINKSLALLPLDDETEALIAGLKANRNKIMAILYKAEDEEIPGMLKDESKVKGIQVMKNNSINELFQEEIVKIIESNSFEEAEKNAHRIPRKQKDNKYTNHFRNFKFFYERLGEKSDSLLNHFAKIFLEKCQIIEIRSWQIEQAITMFNSLNSTGMPLSDADIVSAQLYSNAGENKSIFNAKWKEINRLADTLKSRKIANIDAILQQFMYTNRAINKEYINNGSINVTTPGLRRYYTEIRKELLLEPFSLCDRFHAIAKTWDEIKDYSMVRLLLKFNDNANIYLAGYLSRFKTSEITEGIVEEIAYPLLRLFALLELVDTGYSSKNFKTFLFGVNTKLVDSSVSIPEISKIFDVHIRTTWDTNNIFDHIFDYENNILVFLNDFLYSKSKGEKFEFADNVNVEHIMPSSGRNIEAIRQDAGVSNQDEFRAIVNKLGNKILLEEDINKSLSNEWFKSKKQNSVLTKSGYKDSKYTLASSLTTYPSLLWTKDDITKATRKVQIRIASFIFDKPIVVVES
ncbi:MAG: DUF262 domain-containing protein [Gammaproteobacteria bacterium]